MKIGSPPKLLGKSEDKKGVLLDTGWDIKQEGSMSE